MAVVQSIQSQQFALESRATGVDAATAQRARLALADLALRNVGPDDRGALVELLEMLGLAAQPAIDDGLPLAITS